MSERADAHIHVFEGGYAGGGFTSRPGVSIDEAACYDSLAEEHGVRAALVVGYESFDWCAANNEHLAAIRGEYDWLNPVAFVHNDRGIDRAELERLRAQGFVGISLYLSAEDDCGVLTTITEDCWKWLVANRWLISVNSRGDAWRAWMPLLERYPDLRLIVAHLGLPPAVAQPPDAETAREKLASVLHLATFPGPRVKLSGFYAATDPGHDYPHRAAWPYVEALLASFTSERLLFASDFSPCLDFLSYPQTLGLFDSMPFLDDADRARIRGENLLALLAEVHHAGDG